MTGTPVLRADATDDDSEPDTGNEGAFTVTPNSDVIGWEPYETGQGGWGYHPIYARKD